MASFPPGLEASGDIAFLEGRLLATARYGAPAIDELVEFFPTTGRSAHRARGIHLRVGLAAFGPTLYGMTGNGQVLAINATTRRGRQIAARLAMFYRATARYARRTVAFRGGPRALTHTGFLEGEARSWEM